MVGVGSDGWRVEDAMINGGQAVDTVGNKNIKTPQGLSPAHAPAFCHRKYGSTDLTKSSILLYCIIAVFQSSFNTQSSVTNVSWTEWSLQRSIDAQFEC